MRQVPKNKEEEKDQQAYRDSDSRSRSEEHTSELQSQSNLVCRLLLEKKKNDDDADQDVRGGVAQDPQDTDTHEPDCLHTQHGEEEHRDQSLHVLVPPDHQH